MPKLPPPPRMAQKRSGFSSAAARRTVPSAITISADSRLSSARPYFGMSHPSPPPSVNPAMPVVPTTPPVVARPCSCVSRFNSFQRTPPCARAVRRAGWTWMPFIGARSIIRPAVDRAPPADVVAATADGNLEIQRARELHRVRDVRRAATARDDGGPLVNQSVVDAPGLVVEGIRRLQELAGERGRELIERRGDSHREPLCS